MTESTHPKSPLHPAITALLATLRLGDPKIHNGLGLWPVFADCRPEPAYITLVEALSFDGFKITEISEGGSVPHLRVINETPHHVLLFDGEELKGAKQNRILNTTILIAAGSALDVPVSCTEQGRWSYDTPEFGTSGSVAYAELRKRKALDVAINLKAHETVHRPAVGHELPVHLRVGHFLFKCACVSPAALCGVSCGWACLAGPRREVWAGHFGSARHLLSRSLIAPGNPQPPFRTPHEKRSDRRTKRHGLRRPRTGPVAAAPLPPA